MNKCYCAESVDRNRCLTTLLVSRNHKKKKGRGFCFCHPCLFRKLNNRDTLARWGIYAKNSAQALFLLIVIVLYIIAAFKCVRYRWNGLEVEVVYSKTTRSVRNFKWCGQLVKQLCTVLLRFLDFRMTCFRHLISRSTYADYLSNRLRKEKKSGFGKKATYFCAPADCVIFFLQCNAYKRFA